MKLYRNMNLKFTLIAGMALALASCEDSKFSGYTKAKETGVYYKFFTRNEKGTPVDSGCGIYMRYIISTYPKDSVIVNSKEVSRDGSGYTGFRFNGPTFKGGCFEDGLAMMREGDSAAFIIRADSFYLKTMRFSQLPPGVEPGSYLKGVFALKQVKPSAEVNEELKRQKEEYELTMKKMEAEEQAKLSEYLVKNKITTPPKESGLIYIETKKGSGPMPKETDVVKVHYTGTLLDGTVFDSSVQRGEPVEFPLNQVIMGWTEGLQLMGKGGKAKLIIPSSIGYGQRGQGPIPPFSTLLFEVELLDIITPPKP